MQTPKQTSKPQPKTEEPESTTEMIAALCEISIETADQPPSSAQIEKLERRLKAIEPPK